VVDGPIAIPVVPLHHIGLPLVEKVSVGGPRSLVADRPGVRTF